jgi:hypothetical protein
MYFLSFFFFLRSIVCPYTSARTNGVLISPCCRLVLSTSIIYLNMLLNVERNFAFKFYVLHYGLIGLSWDKVTSVDFLVS